MVRAHPDAPVATCSRSSTFALTRMENRSSMIQCCPACSTTFGVHQKVDMKPLGLIMEKVS